MLPPPAYSPTRLFKFNGNPTVNIALYGKNGSPPANGTDGTELGSTSFTDTDDGSAGRTILSNDLATAYDYVWIHFSTPGDDEYFRIAEIEFYEPGPANNLTVASEPFSADTDPDEIAILAVVDEAESATINADYEIEVSRDGGSTWTDVTLEYILTDALGRKQVRGTADVSGQPSGTDVQWRYKTTGVMVELHAVDIFWRVN